jgi:hypothetical protein
MSGNRLVGRDRRSRRNAAEQHTLADGLPHLRDPYQML